MSNSTTPYTKCHNNGRDTDPVGCFFAPGEVTEWLKVHAWNACVRKYREFESHPLRQIFYSLYCFLQRESYIVPFRKYVEWVAEHGVIAGSCATVNHELRQVREEAAVVNLSVCCRVARLSFFVLSDSAAFRYIVSCLSLLALSRIDDCIMCRDDSHHTFCMVVTSPDSLLHWVCMHLSCFYVAVFAYSLSFCKYIMDSFFRKCAGNRCLILF